MKKVDDICVIVLCLGLIASFAYVGGIFVDRLLLSEGPIAVASELDKPPKTHQVLPGDTLWGIATKYYPNHHTGEMVYEIRKLNGLEESATLYPYTMVLKLPEVD